MLRPQVIKIHNTILSLLRYCCKSCNLEHVVIVMFLVRRLHLWLTIFGTPYCLHCNILTAPGDWAMRLKFGIMTLLETPLPYKRYTLYVSLNGNSASLGPKFDCSCANNGTKTKSGTIGQLSFLRCYLHSVAVSCGYDT